MDIQALGIRVEDCICAYKQNWETQNLHILVKELKKLNQIGIVPFLFTIEPIFALQTILRILNLNEIDCWHIYDNGESVYNPTTNEPYLICNDFAQISFFKDLSPEICRQAEAFNGQIEFMADTMLCIELPDEKTIKQDDFIEIILNQLQENNVYIDPDTQSGDLRLELRYYEKATLLFISLPQITEENALLFWSEQIQIPIKNIAMICSDDTDEQIIHDLGYSLCLANSLDIVTSVTQANGYDSLHPRINGVIDCIRHLSKKI